MYLRVLFPKLTNPLKILNFSEENLLIELNISYLLPSILFLLLLLLFTH